MGAIGNFGGDLWKYYIDGGMTMHFISALWLTSLSTIIYKLIIFRQVKLNLNEFISKVRGALLKGNIKGAMGVCEEYRGPVAAIVQSSAPTFSDHCDTRLAPTIAAVTPGWAIVQLMANCATVLP